MHELERLYCITYDSWDGYYVVHTPRGEVKFHKDEQGLPYINLDESDEEAAVLLIQMMEQQDKENKDGTEKELTLVQTMRGNYEGFTKQEVIKAREAKEAQAMLGNPSEEDFQGLVSGNLIPNCPIARANISNARKIFEPDSTSIRGKTVRRMPGLVVADYVAIPRQLVDAKEAVTLAADVFFVYGITFLITVSRRIKFVTTEHLPVRTATSLSKHLQRVLLVYGRTGFRVRSILMDGEFEKVKGLMPTVECNTTAVKEHVSKVERYIRMVKERTRGIVTMLSFTHIPLCMKIEFVYFTVLWLNAFPVKTGISSTYFPREILVRWRLDYKKHCRVLPGTYCEVYDKPDPSNSMVGHTHEGIALGPTGNLQGSVNFLFEYRAHAQAAVVHGPTHANESDQTGGHNWSARSTRSGVPPLKSE